MLDRLAILLVPNSGLVLSRRLLIVKEAIYIEAHQRDKLAVVYLMAVDCVLDCHHRGKREEGFL